MVEDKKEEVEKTEEKKYRGWNVFKKIKNSPHRKWILFFIFMGSIRPGSICTLSLLFTTDDPVSDTHKCNEETDRSNSEFTGDCPKEDEKTDTCKGVLDAL